MKSSAALRCLRSLRIGWKRLGLTLAALLLCPVSDVAAQAPTLEGVWAQVITPRDCVTGAPLPFPSFRAMLTFHRDGTVTESVGTLSFAPGQRSIGHGTWTRAGGLTFKERTAAMILFDGGLYQTGWQVVARTIVMTNANTYTGFGESLFYDANRQLYRTACASSVGERFQ